MRIDILNFGMTRLCALFTPVRSHECVQAGLFVTSLSLFLWTAGVLDITLIDIYVSQRNIHTHRTPEEKEKKIIANGLKKTHRSCSVTHRISD